MAVGFALRREQVAQRRARHLEMLLEIGHGVSVDLFGERVSDPAVADEVLEDYLGLVAALPPPPADVWLSVDLSHLALSAGAEAAATRLAAIANALPAGRRVQVGAEEAALTDQVNACVLAVAADGLADRLGATVQANLVRSPADADALAGAGVHVRLVKAPTSRQPAPTDTASRPTSPSCNSASGSLSVARRGLWPPTTAVCVKHCSSRTGRCRSSSCSACARRRCDELHDRGVPTRVYVPYGAEWFRYWMRRLAESRGA